MSDDVIEPRGAVPWSCADGHNVPEHGQGSLFRCRGCRRWMKCVFHRSYPGASCRLAWVHWWNFRQRRMIRAHGAQKEAGADA